MRRNNEEQSDDATYGIDAPSCTEEQAVMFMVHHLKLATAYFEVIPDNLRTRSVMLRKACGPERDISYIPPYVTGMEAFLKAMDALYAGMDDPLARRK